MHPTPHVGVCVCRKLQVLPRVTLRWAASLRVVTPIVLQRAASPV